MLSAVIIDIDSISTKLENERANLNNLIHSDADNDEIYSKSTEIDKLITMYIETISNMNKKLDTIRMEYNNKIKLNNRIQIKKKLVRDIGIAFNVEDSTRLKELCEEIFISCILEVCNYNDKEILSYLDFKINKMIFETSLQSDKVIFCYKKECQHHNVQMIKATYINKIRKEMKKNSIKKKLN